MPPYTAVTATIIHSAINAFLRGVRVDQIILEARSRHCSAASSECALPIRLTLVISAEDKANRLEACTASLPPEVAELDGQQGAVVASAEPVAQPEAAVVVAAPDAQPEAEAAAAESGARAAAGKLPTIGFFSSNTPSAASPWTAAFVQRLRDLGWIEGRTVAIEYRWGEGRTERTTEFVAAFVRLKADVIVTHAVPNVLAAKRATPVIPMVFALAADLVGSGFKAEKLAISSCKSVSISSLQVHDAGETPR
jgi:hypothetical protein